MNIDKSKLDGLVNAINASGVSSNVAIIQFDKASLQLAIHCGDKHRIFHKQQDGKWIEITEDYIPTSYIG